jgi:hypothetical protein
VIEKEIIIWKHIETEKVADYKELLNKILILGYTIKGVTVDGKRGLYKLFKSYPIQFCHFHQKKIIQRYLTMNPKLEVSKELKQIVSNLTVTNEINFTKKLDEFYEKNKNFLEEKTINQITQKETYKHYKLMAGYKSLRKNLPYLFIYKKNKNLHIQNTTNSLDGGVFSPMKILLNIHRGFNKDLKLKMVNDYLVNYKKKE